jgi:hypothetical protein
VGSQGRVSPLSSKPAVEGAESIIAVGSGKGGAGKSTTAGMGQMHSLPCLFVHRQNLKGALVMMLWDGATNVGVFTSYWTNAQIKDAMLFHTGDVWATEYGLLAHGILSLELRSLSCLKVEILLFYLWKPWLVFNRISSQSVVKSLQSTCSWNCCWARDVCVQEKRRNGDCQC